MLWWHLLFRQHSTALVILCIVFIFSVVENKPFFFFFFFLSFEPTELCPWSFARGLSQVKVKTRSVWTKSSIENSFLQFVCVLVRGIFKTKNLRVISTNEIRRQNVNNWLEMPSGGQLVRGPKKPSVRRVHIPMGRGTWRSSMWVHCELSGSIAHAAEERIRRWQANGK